jgi:hypothetical protein
MGEYAKRRTDGQEVKIGTCENMYYLRWEDRNSVQPLPGNVDPSRELGLRFRLPYPDEDDTPIGQHSPYNRGLPLVRQTDLGSEYLSLPDTERSTGNLQMKHDSGLLVNVTCYHGNRLPDLGEDGTAHWNGKSYSLELAYVKTTTEGVLPIIRCKHCQTMWMVSWDEVWDYIPESMQERLAVHHELPNGGE